MPQPKEQLIKDATLARNLRDAEGKRRFYPFHVLLDVQLSRLSVTTDTLDFYLYSWDIDRAIKTAFFCFNKWCKYDQGKKQRDYPKVTNRGTALAISDKEYAMVLQQAEANNRTVMRAGNPRDPVAFHVVPEVKIILPANFSQI